MGNKLDYGSMNLLSRARADDKQADVGDYVSFGSFEQDNNLNNGKEEIEWLELAKEGNKVLLISRYKLYIREKENKRTQ